MAITDLPLFQALRHKLSYHEQRQQVLADNIANAQTPGFVASDLRAPDFTAGAAGASLRPVAAAVTSARHIAAPGLSAGGDFRLEQTEAFEVTPDGNAVNLEEQMMKVAANQLDYQLATSLYQRSLGLLRTAIGRRA